MDARAVWRNLGWLVVLVTTVGVPLALDANGRLTYFTSLLLWAIPIAYLWPLFLGLTADGTGRRRRALRWSAGTIAGLGVVLDFLIGHLTFRFPGCGATGGASPYAWCLPAVGGPIPVEEVLFYVMGPVAMVLAYACADEHWLSRYTSPLDRLDGALVRVSPRLVATGAATVAVALVAWRVNGTFPTYFAYLTAGALLPSMFLYRAISHLTNWPAMAVTMLYVMVTSIVWEVTLAIPREWWGYEPSGMLGPTIAAWSRGDAIFPVEAAAVWLLAPFTSTLIYEFAKAFFHHPRDTRTALFGPVRRGGSWGALRTARR